MLKNVTIVPREKLMVLANSSEPQISVTNRNIT